MLDKPEVELQEQTSYFNKKTSIFLDDLSMQGIEDAVVKCCGTMESR